MARQTSVTLTVIASTDEWAKEWGLDLAEVKADLTSYLTNAIQSIPVDGIEVVVKP